MTKTTAYIRQKESNPSWKDWDVTLEKNETEKRYKLI